MKKFILIVICLSLLVGCKNDEKSEEEKNSENVFVLQKIDKDKDYVYYVDYNKVMLGNEEYIVQYPVVNIVSEEIDNLNLELKSFVTKSFKDSSINNGKLNQGYVFSYDYYEAKNYLSVIQKYYTYVNGIRGEIEDKIYVVSLNSGKIVDNNSLLDAFDLTEESFFENLEDKIISDDVAYSLMNIKSNGYQLYVNSDNHLVVVYSEVTDEEEMRKELVLN